MYDLSQGKVHPSVAVHQEPIECLAALELNEHWVAGRGREKAQGKLACESAKLREKAARLLKGHTMALGDSIDVYALSKWEQAANITALD